MKNIDKLEEINKEYNYPQETIKNFLQSDVQIKLNSELEKIPLMTRKQIDKLLELLVSTTKFLEIHNIDYWLDGGTLLGACRNEKFIPWDDDIDIAIPLESYFKIKKMFVNDLILLNNQIKIIEHYNPNIFDKSKPYMFRAYYFDSSDYFIDIIVYQELIDGKISGNHIDWINKYYYFKEEIYPLVSIRFENKIFKCVNNPIPYLNRSYLFWKHLALVSHSHRADLVSGRNHKIYYLL